MKKLYGVIGDPIAHSLSPAMHNKELQELEIDAYYHPFHIKGKDLKMAVDGMKVIGVAGFNVTIPHKTAIIPLLDKVDPLAEAIGAVNTVVREDNLLVGYNTDGAGFVESLKQAWKEDFTGERALIIGAGGAAKAIYYTLLSIGVQRVDICNRTIQKAEALIAGQPYQADSKAITLEEGEANIGDYSLIIQTTSIGMDPEIGKSPISLEGVRSSAFVSDIIYNPAETMFLKQAAQKGAKTQNGLGMLVYQGALAFEKWTNVKPDVLRMKQTLTNFLEESPC
ncbi:shikimate dehydrogenase [Siminovitchia terrae]|uniref:Shikimate dehydrogenase (NADP(+)) n=1 Tax=Siminovitchia terrae TaxID=1914933 RepID=A0A429XDI4_SIMTE|nr:shikimate dehydrogenase [Siminovitchia terrae]RST61514.1 shikimate dehydrogenase [Siminovitchia terrae]